jgi:hypothetical protein
MVEAGREKGMAILRGLTHPQCLWNSPTNRELTQNITLQFSHLLDASREDGSLVMLKRISVSRHPYEAEIGQLFSSEPLTSDTKNCCVPFYDVLRIPDDDDGVILVMPLLYEVECPPFETVGEVVEFFARSLR